MTILQKKIKLKSQFFHKIFFLYYFLLPTLNTTTCSLLVSVSVLADMKNYISVFYLYRPIRKLYLSAHIGIGRFEKKLIICSLLYSLHHSHCLNFYLIVALIVLQYSILCINLWWHGYVTMLLVCDCQKI